MPGNNQLCGSWGVIRKYLRGNLVFRPNYPSKMYYDKFMHPWEHYIPVDSDFSDLHKQYSWAEDNQYKSAQIAWKGCSIANNYLRNIKTHFIEASSKKIKLLDNN